MKERKKRVECTDTDFVIAYMQADTIDDVARITGLHITSVYNRRKRLSNLGVEFPPLKNSRASIRTQLEVAQLNSLIKNYKREEV